MSDKELAVKEDGELRNKSFDEVDLQSTSSSSDRSNLIINYLPPDFDDSDLTVSFIVVDIVIQWLIFTF